jgi:thiol-disulfide isomerase/thioredoxin
VRSSLCLIGFSFLLVAIGIVSGQPTESVPQDSAAIAGETASAFLDRILKHYETAKTYHLELVDEVERNTEMSRSLEKRSFTAIVLPDKRFRFEAQSDMGSDAQISDGVTQWLFIGQIGQYTKESASISIPSAMPRVPVPGLNRLLEARRLLGRIAAPRAWLRSAKYLEDETIEVNGTPEVCTVVQATGAKPGAAGTSRHIETTYRFWISKSLGTIWKELEHTSGEVFADLPHIAYTLDRTTLFKVSELDSRSAPAELFVFNPNYSTKLVTEFRLPREAMVQALQGQKLSAITLGVKDGKTISLDSFHGKPILFDFWATWCFPCRESFRALEKLYKETASKGLIVIGIDDDEEAKSALDFLARRNDGWLNFHLTDEIASAFPEHGIPYFVLVDASRKVVYSRQGMDEGELRDAIAHLGPEFANLSRPAPHREPAEY